MKVLVTGASGLLGAELCRQLKSQGHEVWAVDNHSRSSLIPDCDHWLKLDLSDADNYRSLPQDFHYIYHYSAINGTKNFYERPNTVLDNNFTSDVMMFRFAQSCIRLQQLVYASSSEIVAGDPQSPVSENTAITIDNIHNPRWSYRLAKVCAENYLVNSQLPWLICRYFNVYGEHSKAGHFVADQIDKIGRGEFSIIGPEETRSFCYVSDAIAATIYCAQSVSREVVNIGNDREIRILDAANIIASALGHENVQWQIKPSLAGSTPTRRPNIDRLRQIMTSYAPISFEEAIARMLTKR